MFFGIFNRANSNEVPRFPPFPMDYSIVANIPHNFDRKTFQSWRNHNQPGPCSVLSHQEHSWSDIVRLEYKDTSTQKHKYTNTTWCREDWVTWGHRRSHWPGCIHGGTGRRSPFTKYFSPSLSWFHDFDNTLPVFLKWFSTPLLHQDYYQCPVKYHFDHLSLLHETEEPLLWMNISPGCRPGGRVNCVPWTTFIIIIIQPSLKHQPLRLWSSLLF